MHVSPKWRQRDRQEAWCDRVRVDNPDLKKSADRQRAWLDAGTDPLTVVLERAKARSLPVLAGFRLNRFMPKFGMESWFEKNPYVALSDRTQVLGAIDNIQALPEPERLRESEAVIRSVSSTLDGVYLFNTQPLHLAFLLEGAAQQGACVLQS